MNKIFLLLLCGILMGKAQAQTKKIEQLKEQVSLATAPEAKLRALLNLCDQHSSLHKDSLYKYALEARSLAARQKDGILKGRADIAMAYAFLQSGDTDSAAAIIETALPTCPVTNQATRPLYFELSAQKADCFGDASNYKEALQLLYNIVAEAELYKDSTVLAKNMNTIGVINYNIDDVPDAFNWYYKGISYTSADSKFDALKGALYINLADVYRWVEKTDSATYFIDLAIPICERSENLFYLSNALRVKSSIYKKQKKFAEAEKLMLQSIDISERINGKRLFSNEGLALAQLYRTTGNTQKAIDMLKAALAADSASHQNDSGSYDRLRIEYYHSLANCYQSIGDQQNYIATLESLMQEKDNFYEANSAQAIAELKTRYELQKKESTIIKQQLDLTQKNYLFYGTLIALLFAAALAVLLFKNYRRKQQLKTEQLLYEEKVASLNAIKTAEENERKRIAADLHDNLGAYAASIVSNLDQIALQQQETKNLVPFQELRNNSKAIVAQLGDTIWALKTDELSLTAISDRVKIFMQRLQPSYPSISMEVREDIQHDHVLPALQAFHLMRILQEAINNALKHSHCRNINMVIYGAEHWQISLVDDGSGFDTETIHSKGYGLYNMKSRAAEFSWNLNWQSSSSGTTVLISPTTN
jgi:signal transduction histidine kinase